MHCKVIRTHSRVLPETEHYSLNSIPPSELGELFQKYNLDSERDLDEILDMCIGSAVFVITKYVKRSYLVLRFPKLCRFI